MHAHNTAVLSFACTRTFTHTPSQRFAACIIRLREPKATALLFHTGKLVLTGAKNEDDARLGARKVAKIVSALGFAAAFVDFRVQNVVATGDCGFPIRLEGLADSHQKWSSVRRICLPSNTFWLRYCRTLLAATLTAIPDPRVCAVRA